MRGLVGLACGCVILTASAGADVTVLLTQNGTETVWRTYAPGVAITDLPALGDSYQMVRVYADSEEAVGPITLVGTRNTTLDVLIAGPQATAMPGPSAALARGAASLAGISVASGLGPKVRLAASVGAVTGAIDVGTVVILEADELNAPVTARAADAGTVPAIWTIAVSRRCNAGADITAANGSIGSVAVGHGLRGEGLYAGIESAGGSIQSVEVCGEVVIAAPKGIRARDGITLIRCTSIDETGRGAVNAAIDANTGNHAGNEHPTRGALITLDCDTLSGSVRARSLDDGLGGGQRTSIRAGMVFAAIDIADRVVGRIETAGFEPPGRITIGGDLAASISADRGITSLEVGGSVQELFFCIPTEITCANGSIGTLSIGGDALANGACESVVTIAASGGIGAMTVGGDALCALVCGSADARSPLGTLSVGGSWYEGTISASGVGAVDIRGQFNGTFHIDELAPSSLIRIGQQRGGTIIVHHPAGLGGMVIGNAMASEAVADAGAVLVAKPERGWNSWEGQPCPFACTVLGGGMVADVPFSLRMIDCVPASCKTCSLGAVAQGSMDSSGVLIRFSGPVRKAANVAKPLHLYPADPEGARIEGAPEWSGPIELLQVDARTFRVTTPEVLPAGTWVLESSPHGLLCDQLMAGGNVSVRPFEFAFVVQGCGGADFNRDGDIGTDADIEAYFACLGGRCCPACSESDFNGDGDTGTDADIEAFFRVLGGGGC